jgi:hypothetical protein
MKNCIKEIGWWIFKTKTVIHSWKVSSIGKFMSSSDTFHVHYKCENCGATKTKRFIEKDTLILMGIPVEEIEKITNWDYWYPKK